jgi:hypothetical protein
MLSRTAFRSKITASYIELTEFEVSTYFTRRVPGLLQRGKEWRGGCPMHNGKDPNFSVNP